MDSSQPHLICGRCGLRARNGTNRKERSGNKIVFPVTGTRPAISIHAGRPDCSLPKLVRLRWTEVQMTWLFPAPNLSLWGSNRLSRCFHKPAISFFLPGSRNLMPRCGPKSQYKKDCSAAALLRCLCRPAAAPLAVWCCCWDSPCPQHVAAHTRVACQAQGVVQG